MGGCPWGFCNLIASLSGHCTRHAPPKNTFLLTQKTLGALRRLIVPTPRFFSFVESAPSTKGIFNKKTP